MYSFSFEAGVAIIRSTKDSVIVMYQPFKPVNAGQEPWTNAAEAEEWFKENYPQYFYHLQTPPPPDAPSDENVIPGPADEEQAEPGTGE